MAQFTWRAIYHPRRVELDVILERNGVINQRFNKATSLGFVQKEGGVTVLGKNYPSAEDKGLRVENFEYADNQFNWKCGQRHNRGWVEGQILSEK